MKKVLILVLVLACSLCASAQRLSLEKLRQLLPLSLEATEEQMFLVGYSFLSKEALPEDKGLSYTFSNRKNTIGTAKKLTKTVYGDNSKAMVRYTTYDRGEFENFRKAVLEDGFVRSLSDKISENSNFYKDNLHVQFQVTKDQYENPTFLISMGSDKLDEKKNEKKFSLRNIIRKED